jgi:hypothetical protein
MKNYIIGVLLVGIILLSSIIYKNGKELILQDFPIEKIVKKQRSDIPYFYIYLFFSKRNCPDCLKVIDVLNNLPEYFIVRGIVPAEELSEEKNLRETTGAKFELESMSKKYQKFLPLYNPTIYGVDSQGIIYFILPGIPQEEDYLKRFLVTFYYKTYNLLKDCGGNCGKK